MNLHTRVPNHFDETSRGPIKPAAPAHDLSFRSVGFRANGRTILDKVSLDARAGEVLCLLGPSGSGKTSLLRIAAGIERPTSGDVWIGTQRVAGSDSFVPPEKRGVGLVFQDFALFPHMSVLENVRYGLGPRSSGEGKRSAFVALDRVGLGPLADSYPHQLSGGEQQRVALARALAPGPRVLLMDEPFSGLDSRLKDRVRDETLRILREIGTTAIVVTHDAEEAMRMADRIALLREGRLVQVGTPRELHGRPVDLFAAAFLSEINVLPGLVRAGKVSSPIGIVADSPRSDGTKMEIGVRLSGLRLSGEPKGVPARVLDRRFLGEVEMIHLAVDGLDESLKARLRPGELADNVHDVFVTVDPAETFVFERADGSV